MHSVRPTSALDLGLHSRVATSYAASAANAVGLDVPAAAITNPAGATLTGRTSLRSPSPGSRTASALAAVVAAAAVHADGASGAAAASGLGMTTSTKLPRIPSPGTYAAEQAAAAAAATGGSAALAAAAAAAAARHSGRPVSAVPSDIGAFIQEVGLTWCVGTWYFRQDLWRVAGWHACKPNDIDDIVQNRKVPVLDAHKSLTRFTRLSIAGCGR